MNRRELYWDLCWFADRLFWLTVTTCTAIVALCFTAIVIAGTYQIFARGFSVLP